MCGIVGGYTDITKGLQKLIHRGPNFQAVKVIDDLQFGHTRLAILDLDKRSNQPFKYNNTLIIFNGEIWNYKELRKELEIIGFQFKTTGDTEVLAAVIDKWGTKGITKLNGMFAIAWVNMNKTDTFYLARDKYGEIPLHIAKQTPFCFASEIKALLALSCNPKSFDSIPPGHYAIITPTTIKKVAYYDIPLTPHITTRKEAHKNLYNLLKNGVEERIIADVPICTLLSGGIDSAIIAYFLSKKVKNIVAYTAVYNKKSNDLKQARLVANYLNIELIEVPVKIPTTHDISRVIHHIEMPYKAQVEIGWPCLKLAEVIKADGFKVVFSGEGSDELWASYGFAYHALQKINWHTYRKSLFLSQANKNFIRCNKIFMANSIECRLPFLNPSLVDYAISLPKLIVQNGRSKPKAILQESFINKLPNSVVKRPKIAFQDGMGIKKAILQNISNPKRFYNAEFKKQYR